MAAGVGAALFSFIYTWIRFDYGALAPGLLIAMFVLSCLSLMIWRSRSFSARSAASIA